MSAASRLALVAAIALAACSSAPGFTIDLTVETPSSTLTDDELAHVASLEIAVSGKQLGSMTYPFGGGGQAFAREERLAIVGSPTGKAGPVSIDVTARDGAHNVLASGHVDGIDLEAGAYPMPKVTLTRGPMPGADLAGMTDGGAPADLAGSDGIATGADLLSDGPAPADANDAATQDLAGGGSDGPLGGGDGPLGGGDGPLGGGDLVVASSDLSVIGSMGDLAGIPDAARDLASGGGDLAVTDGAADLAKGNLDGGAFQIVPASIVIVPGMTQKFTVTPGTSVTWARTGDGTIDPFTGVYTAPLLFKGQADVTATANGTTQHATVLVSGLPPLTIVPSPDPLTVAPGATATFTAKVYPTSASQSVLWSVVESGGGKIDPVTGQYTAPAGAGDFHVVATSTADVTRQTVVPVHVVGAPQVTLVPSEATVLTGPISGDSVAFTAQVLGGSGGVTFALTDATGKAVTGLQMLDGAHAIFTLPSGVAPTQYTVTATAQAAPHPTDTSTITIVAPQRTSNVISGTLTGGTEGARGYVSIVNGSDLGQGCLGGGTSVVFDVNGKAPFVVRGVQVNSGAPFTLLAWQDVSGLGAYNAASDPFVKYTHTAPNGSPWIWPNVTLPLGPPPSLTPTTPAAGSNNAAVMIGQSSAGGPVFVGWNRPQSNTSPAVELADHYNVYLGASSSVGPGSYYQLRTAVSQGQSFVLFDPVAPGTVWAAVTSVIGGVESAPTAPVSYSVQSAAGGGGWTGTGSLDVPESPAPTGTLYGALDTSQMNMGPAVLVHVGSATVPSTVVSIPGVPGPGPYTEGLFLDLLGDGQITALDLQAQSSASMPFMVTSNFNLPTLAFSASAQLTLTTNHNYGPNQQGTYQESWSVNYKVQPNGRMPSTVTLVQSPPNNWTVVPGDLGMDPTLNGSCGGPGGNNGDITTAWHAYMPVGAGDASPWGKAMTFDVAYTDGSFDVLSATIGAPLALPVLSTPVKNGSSVYVFSWTPPSGVPSGSTIQISVWPTGMMNGSGGTNGMLPAGTTSIAYNMIGSSQPALVTGTAYSWSIQINTPAGDSTSATATFTAN